MAVRRRLLNERRDTTALADLLNQSRAGPPAPAPALPPATAPTGDATATSLKLTRLTLAGLPSVFGSRTARIDPFGVRSSRARSSRSSPNLLVPALAPLPRQSASRPSPTRPFSAPTRPSSARSSLARRCNAGVQKTSGETTNDFLARSIADSVVSPDDLRLD